MLGLMSGVPPLLLGCVTLGVTRLMLSLKGSGGVVVRAWLSGRNVVLPGGRNSGLCRKSSSRLVSCLTEWGGEGVSPAVSATLASNEQEGPKCYLLE